MDEVITVKNKVAFMISMTIIGIAGIFLLIAGVLAFVPVDVVKPNVQPYKVLTPIIKAGQPVVYQADVCKYKEASSIVVRSFVDENHVVYPIPQQASNVPSGCQKNNVTVASLPSFHPGNWYITLDIQYQVNILRTESYHFKTATFTIIKPTLQGVQ